MCKDSEDLRYNNQPPRRLKIEPLPPGEMGQENPGKKFEGGCGEHRRDRRVEGLPGRHCLLYDADGNMADKRQNLRVKKENFSTI